MGEVPTASQTVGPFFSIGLERHYLPDMLPAIEGEARFTVRGRVLDGDGEPVPDAVLEIWRPGSDKGKEGFDPASQFPNGFVRVATDAQGLFRFTALKPVVDDSRRSENAPHFAVLIFMRGLLRHLVTRFYFPGEPGNESDALLRLVPAERRETLIARQSVDGLDHLVWDIHLQGERETVFFQT
jgi:protocatechuate 3,4-dioxygenase alpha subunit